MIVLSQDRRKHVTENVKCTLTSTDCVDSGEQITTVCFLLTTTGRLFFVEKSANLWDKPTTLKQVNEIKKKF